MIASPECSRTVMEDDGNMQQFHTPKMEDSDYDPQISVRESYRPYDEEEIPNFPQAGLLSDSEIEQLRHSTNLPPELCRAVDQFVDDLKQPKYFRPLTVLQLSGLFQRFYASIDHSTHAILNNTTQNTNASSSTLFSSLFVRSRSNSATGRHRSTSLYSNSSNTSIATPLMSPEEMNAQLRANERNKIKAERYLQLCQQQVFYKIAQLGTSVPTSHRHVKPTLHSNFRVSTLFRNSPKFIDFDKLFNEKVACIRRLDQQGRVGLPEFLGVPSNIIDNHECVANKLKHINEHFKHMILRTVSPYEKIEELIRIHDSMLESTEASNDEYLSLLILYIIKLNPRRVFLTLEFIKLFSYKKKLVDRELFVLTNFEAAIMFLESLTSKDLPDNALLDSNEEEAELFEKALSDRIKIPTHFNATENESEHIMHYPDEIRAGSYDGLKSVLDQSLKNIFNRVKTYTPPSSMAETLATSNSQVSITSIARAEPFPSKATDHATSEASSQNEEIREPQNLLNLNIRKYQDRTFDDMNIRELKEMFEIYQTLIRD